MHETSTLSSILKMSLSPKRTELIDFWTAQSGFRWKQCVPYVAYLLPLVICAFFAVQFNVAPRYRIALAFCTLLYVVLAPTIFIRWYWRKYERFIRCPHCGDWLGRDASGTWFGSNPKWIRIAETGRCQKCGHEIFTLDAETENQDK
jgi:DNA-directed RNA polymerase subunit RPC12/RpoP